MTVNVPTSYQKLSITRMLWNKTYKYFRNEEHKKDFEKWHIEKYGIPYDWSNNYETSQS